MPAKLTPVQIAEFIDDLAKRNIRMIGEYVNATTRHQFECTVENCDHVWKAVFYSVKNLKSGCKKCAGLYLDEKTIAKRIKSVNDRSIELLEPYNGMHKKILFKCNVLNCEHTWRTTFDEVFRGKGCAKCAGLYLDAETIACRIKSLDSRNIELLDEYNGMHNKNKFKCKIKDCENIWRAKFIEVFRGKGCSKCLGNFIDEKEVKRRIQSLQDRGIEMLDPYQGMSKRVRFKCRVNDCNREWTNTLHDVYTGTGVGCFRCSKRRLTPEQRLKSKAHNILRKRLSNAFYKGYSTSKIYRTDGELNEVYYTLFPHWAEQYKIFMIDHPEPIDGQTWELDHIVPISWFDPYDLETLKLCWHSKNLQWLTERENGQKKDNIRLKDLAVLTDWHYDVIAQCRYPKPLPVSAA
jgi:hypothetical protein